MVMSALTVLAALAVSESAPTEQSLPAPDVTDEKYGPHPRNVFDLWKAKSDKPTPLVIFFHGGGFRGGSNKDAPPGLVRGCLEAGISVASVEYRLSNVAPYPAQMLDGARALQYLRSKARAFNLDPNRIGCTGGSAGAGISLWLAFHDDLADPTSADPVLRESTRISCAVGRDGQCSYDPRWIKQNIGGLAYLHPFALPFFNVTPEELLTDKAAKLYRSIQAFACRC